MAAINHNQQFKITKLAKDLGIKSKDLVELLAQNGIEAKTTQKVLDPVEFDVLFDALTRANQITDIGRYLSGESYIPSKVKKTVKATKTEKTADTESDVAKAAPQKEEKARESSAEPTATVKEPPKTQEKKEVSAPRQETKEKKTASAVSAEEKGQTLSPATDTTRSTASEKTTAKAKTEEQHPQNAAAERPGTDPKVASAQAAPTVRPQARQPYTGNPFRPQQSGISAATAAAGARAQTAPSAQGRQNPRTATGTGTSERTAMPNRNSGFTRDIGRTAGSTGSSAFGNAGQGSAFGSNRQKAGSQPFNKNGKDSRGGRGGFGGGKGDYVPSAPKDTFKAQPIIRGASTNLNPDGTRKGPRVIDTRSTSGVDLSKYDEKLDSFVSDRDNQNLQGGNQKFKKQSAPGQGFAKSAGNGKKGKPMRKGATPATVVTHKPTHIELPEEIVVGQLASKLMVTAGEVVKKLMLMGVMATVNQVIDYDTAALVADEFGVEASQEVVVSIEEKLFDDAEDTADQLVDRAPVVCVMGHVDHGKTSILDAIRNTHVTAGEAGGITQHIGAYRVKAGGRDITFLDTPGHAAFTAMRARGAMATDIAILVVAADDGIMPQTIEAINHAKAAGIDIVVAINKMDKPTANPDAVKQELTKYGLVPEEWGGDAICVPVSALKNQGIDDLLESVLLVADVKELKANPNRRAKGLVIEAKLDRGRGPVATVLVQNGTLRNGDIIIAGTAVGRVRSMTDHNGNPLKEAAPSVPVEITGLAEVPSAGDEFQAVEDERMARTLADRRRAQAKEDIFKANARANLNDLFAQISEGIKDLNIIVKADVDGSVEAVKASLLKLSNEEVKVRIIHAAAGGITEGDVTLAAASNAIVVGFNVRPDKSALDSAERQGVDVRTYRVIYECIEEIQAAMKGMLAPKFRENLLGHAEVRQTIHVPNVGTIAGSYVQDGKITRQSQIRVVRDGIVIFEDKISSLKRFKDDAKEVASGYECGVGLEKFNDIKVGDILEAFVMEQIQPE